MKKKPVYQGYRIFRQEALADAFKRILLEQSVQNRELCRKFARHPDTVTHEIRKSTKRIRAVYRLYRQAIGNNRYLDGKEFNRILSNQLAPHRISAVYIETLQHIASDKRLTVPSSYINSLIDQQIISHQALTDQLLQETDNGRLLREMISLETLRIRKENPFPCELSNLTYGLRKTYGLGAQSLDKVLQVSNTENLHELRKKVKTIWNQLLFMQPVFPAFMNASIHQFDMLADKLGMDHDLAELERHLSINGTVEKKDQYNILLNYIHKKRLLLQKSIFPLSIKLFAEKPAAFARRIERYYGEFVKRR